MVNNSSTLRYLRERPKENVHRPFIYALLQAFPELWESQRVTTVRMDVKQVEEMKKKGLTAEQAIHYVADEIASYNLYYDEKT